MQESQVLPDEATSPEYMKPGDAAALLGVTTTTLATWAALGHVEYLVLPSGHRRYAAESVRALARTGGAA